MQPFLLTPFENPAENTPDSDYNRNLVWARNIIERLNGVSKSRFRCLLKHRFLNYDPIKAGKIIYSCGVLHNIGRFYNDDFPEEEILEIDDDFDNPVVVAKGQNWHRRGEEMQNLTQ